MKRLFVDMDGTLAQFVPVEQLEELYKPGFFLSLKPQEDVINAVKELVKDPRIDVYILSAYLSDSDYALQEKSTWLATYLPEVPSTRQLFVPCGKSKLYGVENAGMTIGKDDYLLDDYTANLTSWDPPGRGIKLLNGINHTKGTWQKDRLRFDRGNLADCIRDIILNDEVIYDKPPGRTLDEKIADARDTCSAQAKDALRRDVNIPSRDERG